MNWPLLIYLACVAASLVCAALLARAYFRARTRLLLWTAVAFGFFAANNMLLALDMVVLPDVDLYLWRQAAAGLGLASLLYGFVWDAR